MRRLLIDDRGNAYVTSSINSTVLAYCAGIDFISYPTAENLAVIESMKNETAVLVLRTLCKMRTAILSNLVTLRGMFGTNIYTSSIALLDDYVNTLSRVGLNKYQYKNFKSVGSYLTYITRSINIACVVVKNYCKNYYGDDNILDTIIKAIFYIEDGEYVKPLYNCYVQNMNSYPRGCFVALPLEPGYRSNNVAKDDRLYLFRDDRLMFRIITNYIPMKVERSVFTIYNKEQINEIFEIEREEASENDIIKTCATLDDLMHILNKERENSKTIKRNNQQNSNVSTIESKSDTSSNINGLNTSGESTESSDQPTTNGPTESKLDKPIDPNYLYVQKMIEYSMKYGKDSYCPITKFLHENRQKFSVIIDLQNTTFVNCYMALKTIAEFPGSNIVRTIFVGGPHEKELYNMLSSSIASKMHCVFFNSKDGVGKHDADSLVINLIYVETMTHKINNIILLASDRDYAATLQLLSSVKFNLALQHKRVSIEFLKKIHSLDNVTYGFIDDYLKGLTEDEILEDAAIQHVKCALRKLISKNKQQSGICTRLKHKSSNLCKEILKSLDKEKEHKVSNDGTNKN